MLLRLTDRKPDSGIASIVAATIADAKSKWTDLAFQNEYPNSGFGIVDLAPFHVNAGGAGWTNSHYWGVSIATSLTWQDWQNTTLTDMAYVIVTGLFNREAAPATVSIRPHVGGDDFPTVHLEQLYTMEEAFAFFEKPYAVKPQNPFIIRLLADDTGQERIGLMGYCVGKRAFLMTEP